MKTAVIVTLPLLIVVGIVLVTIAVIGRLDEFATSLAPDTS